MRKVKRVVTGIQTEDGAGVKLQRVVGNRDVKDFDPFLMLDGFDSTDPADYVAGFPWHPHRGIETVTYLIEGEIEHGDSLGNRGTIRSGCCQWMTAGCGIIHQEMPQPSKRMLGTQLWINLPAKEKMTPPAYHDIQPESVLKFTEDGARIALIAGSYKGEKAPMQNRFIPTDYLDVDLDAGKSWELEVPPENTVFLYIILGGLEIDGTSYPSRRAVLFELGGDRVKVTAGKEGARFLLASGKPLREPVAWGGPIVMNTREELLQAFREIDDGTFAKGCDKANKGYYDK